ncbi:MAG TPA: hypothetical protein VEW48_19000 [Thermoanaerobaculia bacterium]|nr:hypothetical protein [Thermoanaerobaculia bacterium]
MPTLRSHPELIRAGILFLLAFTVYNANLRLIATGDSRGTRFVPFALLRTGTLDLGSFEPHVTGSSPQAYWARTIDGRLVSTYPVVTPLLVAPLYVPAVVYLERTGWRRIGLLAGAMEKFAASFIAALSVGLMYLLLRRRAEIGDALLLTVAYAFGTNTWATSSQALWQHGPAQLLLIGALLAATGERTAGRLALCGLCCGLLAANRPPDALLAAAVSLWLVMDLPAESRRRLLTAFFLPAASAGLAVAAYNLAVFGQPLGGYLLLIHPGFFDHSVAAGIAGLFLSPGKGLFVFSPFLLFLLARPFVRGTPEDRRLTLCLLAGCAALVLLLARADWRGGYGYGPRYLTELLPVFVWLLIPVTARLGRGLRPAFVAVVLFSMAPQAIGAFRYPFGGSDVVLAGDAANDWMPENAQFLLELRGSRDIQSPRKKDNPFQIHQIPTSRKIQRSALTPSRKKLWTGNGTSTEARALPTKSAPKAARFTVRPMTS